ncbi:MAG: hypothetical protein ACI8Y9_000366 [Paracoccaceae bacterium]|jgi:hypothetical protein
MHTIALMMHAKKGLFLIVKKIAMALSSFTVKSYRILFDYRGPLRNRQVPVG